ncbi:MAG TPA: Gfo/Idh/MocA family oxidoreductase, partial [Limnochorda sp.]
MNTRRVAVVGYGHVGQAAVDAVEEAPDMELAGIVRRDPSQREDIPDRIPVVRDVAELGPVDAALLCVPTRRVPEVAERYLKAGIHTVDSYDMHGELVTLRERLGRIASEHGAVAIISAGWDPGTNSMVRALMELMAPRGITYTNYGPGMS